jgi:[acyl-carrier-protein] S-malonyltransferase
MAKRTVEGARTITVATPDDLDQLLEWLGEFAPAAAPSIIAGHEGEHLFAMERLVVSPSAGIFVPNVEISAGTRISVGQVIGHVGETEVRSSFDGIVQSFIAVDGERVTSHQPIAWLRTN